MDYKKILRDTMISKKYKGKTLEDLKSLFDLSRAEAFTDFMKAINEAVDTYEFIVDDLGRYFLAEKLGYFTGTLRINKKGFGFVENEEFSCFISKSNINRAMDGDEVLARYTHDLWEDPEGEIVKVLKRNCTDVVGTIKMTRNEAYFLPDAMNIDQRIKITNMKQFKLVNDTKVLVHIESYDPILSGKIEKVIGFKYDPGIDILSVLYEHDVPTEFSDEVMKEVNKIPDHVTYKDATGRRDLTDQLIITIDGDDARDLDDAISIEEIDNGYRLGVHIADVSHYVKEGSAIDRSAYERGTSIYVTDRVVPMLPQALSNGICSLNPQVERCTISCVMDIDRSGEITNYQIFPSIIKTTERMTYTNVNKIIHKDPIVCERYEHLLEMVQHMLRLSKIIRKRRVALGAIDFDTKEGKVILDDNGKAVDVVLRTRGESERIIEDFMIQANECVANHVKWLEYPSMYRVHEQPDVKKMREFVHILQSLGIKFKGNILNMKPKQCQELLEQVKKKPEYDVVSTSLLRCMAKAKYDPKCLGHFGLGLQEYTHFTSPIRRYPDLVVHRMLRKYCFNALPDTKTMHKDEKWMEKAAVQCSERERVAVETERDVDDMKKAEYMEKHIGKRFEGVISSITKFGFFVELPNTVEGLVHISTLSDDHYVYIEESKTLLGMRTKKMYAMGQKVKVRCVNASRFKRQVDFEIESKGRPYEKNKTTNRRPATSRVRTKTSTSTSTRTRSTGSKRR